MIYLAILLVCLLGAGIAVIIPSERYRPLILPAVGVAHFGLVLTILEGSDTGYWRHYLAIDPPGKIVLLVISGLFLVCSFYAVGYLRYRTERINRVFCCCLPLFLGAMTLVTCSDHLGVMWIAMEGTTLSCAPLIYFNRTPRSIEATWKFLLICSVGIALALLGSFFVAYSAVSQGITPTLEINGLVRQAPHLNAAWLQGGFIFLLVGYGTKMGLAPMHTWKPDAYGEAPGVVGALMSGGLTSCAFLMVMRAGHILRAAGQGLWTSHILIFMGLLSMAFAALFVVGQKDIKRMLAYSSVENMGILVLGLGIGGPALFGALLHIINNAFTKGVLFLSAGNIHRAFGAKTTPEISGAMRRLPLSGMLFLLGFIAVTGSPPFGPFVSEFMILGGTFSGGHYWAAAAFLILLLIIFLGMGRTVLAVVQGRPSSAARRTRYHDTFLTAAPILLTLLLVLMLGLFIPPPLAAILHQAAAFMGAKR